jgi:hypothetical protein
VKPAETALAMERLCRSPLLSNGSAAVTWWPQQTRTQQQKTCWNGCLLCGPSRGFITMTSYHYQSVRVESLDSVYRQTESWQLQWEAGSWGRWQFRNPDVLERPPLEAATKQRSDDRDWEHLFVWQQYVKCSHELCTKMFNKSDYQANPRSELHYITWQYRQIHRYEKIGTNIDRHKRQINKALKKRNRVANRLRSVWFVSGVVVVSRHTATREGTGELATQFSFKH